MFDYFTHSLYTVLTHNGDATPSKKNGNNYCIWNDIPASYSGIFMPLRQSLKFTQAILLWTRLPLPDMTKRILPDTHDTKWQWCCVQTVKKLNSVESHIAGRHRGQLHTCACLHPLLLSEPLVTLQRPSSKQQEGCTRLSASPSLSLILYSLGKPPLLTVPLLDASTNTNTKC